MNDQKDDQKKTILVIDDDEKLLMATREILEGEGYTVFTHRQGLGSCAAINLVRPDLVLLDINMPGLSGDRLAAMLGAFEFTKNVPVVFYSSNDEDILRRAVSAHKVKGYISKGDLADLRRKVRHYLK
ncbi:MAG: response regulator [Nitrospiraceae bacterium]|nr:response regulator [Nitrospiraceae bacterium]